MLKENIFQPRILCLNEFWGLNKHIFRYSETVKFIIHIVSSELLKNFERSKMKPKRCTKMQKEVVSNEVGKILVNINKNRQ